MINIVKKRNIEYAFFMFKKNAVVLYKNQPAIILEISDKITIHYSTGTQKVREKDIKLLHEGPLPSLSQLILPENNNLLKNEYSEALKEIHELLISDEETSLTEQTIQELAELSKGSYSASDCWLWFSLLIKEPYFTLVEKNNALPTFIPTSLEKINTILAKEAEKENEILLRENFIQRLRKKQKPLPEDTKFLQEIEAFALGKSDKSKILKDAHCKETPENAHKLLLDTGFWNITRNPHPYRWGLSTNSATEQLASPPEEERITVTHTAFAIDNPSSKDPDDAIAFDGEYLWVHIADPASTVIPNSIIDKSARNRGATLYLPEGSARMLCESALEEYALGLNETSRALSFKIKLSDTCSIEDVTVMRTWVKVKRLTYQEAQEQKENPELSPLFSIARQNIQRRKNMGAIFIQMPEVSIEIEQNENLSQVSITPIERFESSDMVREMMLLAGEAAAIFAFKNDIPFPFVTQETPDLPKDIPEGLAGEYKTIRSMRSRRISTTPSSHGGLGLSMYSQVTSPLRRYGDLVAHQQLRAFIKGEKLLSREDVLLHISTGDAAMSAAIKAERKSDLHWTLVYLLQNPNWQGKAVVVEKKKNQVICLIPELALETTLQPSKEYMLNDEISIKVGSIQIHELSVIFLEL